MLSKPTAAAFSLIAAALLVAFATPQAAAEEGNPSLVRINYDPVTGQPTCIVVRPSAGSSVTPGTQIPCPPAVTARPPQTPTNNDATKTPTPETPKPATPTTQTTVIDKQIVFSDAIDTSNAFSVLRFANFGSAAGTAKVVIVNADSGQNVATWNGPQIPSRGGLQIAVGGLFAAAAREPGVTSMPTNIRLHVTASFSGEVQHLIGLTSGGVYVNASACGANVSAPRERLGYVPADAPMERSIVRIVNKSGDAATAKLVLRDAVTGVSQGTWISPSVAANSVLYVPLAKLISEAGTDPSLSAFMIDSEALPLNLRLELSATSVATGAVVDQTTVCVLTPS